MATRKNSAYTPDELVESEIARLSQTAAVKMARKEERLRYQRRQVLYHLRFMEKRGLQLMAEGWTLDTLDLMFSREEEEER